MHWPAPRMCQQKACQGFVCLFGWEAHKTKQAMAKHLALFASLGRFGLSEHILPVLLASRFASLMRGVGVLGQDEISPLAARADNLFTRHWAQTKNKK